MHLSTEGICWESEWAILLDLPEPLSGDTSGCDGTCASIRREVGASLVGDEAWPYIALPIG